MMERRGLPMLNHVLQHTLRSLCSETQWVYAVFWRILPRNYPPPKWETEGGAIDRSKGNKRNWILVWEDGFCDFPACTISTKGTQQPGGRYNHGFNHAADHESTETAAMHPELFFKMSHEVYNYGEGLMGKVAADNSHKWVYREPMEHEISFLSPWHGSLDPHPRTWEAQFKAGIQTIAVISVREGLMQLGSTRKVVEDLNFVILMQRKFNYLQSIPGVFVPHPSPLPSMKRRDGIDSSSPTDHGAYWPSGNKDPSQSLINGLFTRSSSEPYQLTAHNKQFSPGVLGIKRPADNDIMGRDFPFLSPGINFSGSPRFESRQANGQQLPDCSSPPKHLSTAHSPASISLLPSMSSLHNLLSKLPSVTAPESNAPRPHSPARLSLSTTPQAPMSPTSSTDSPGGGWHPAAAEDRKNVSPQPSSRQQQADHQDHDHHRDSSHTGTTRKLGSSFAAAAAASRAGGPPPKDKLLTSFLDSFDDQDSLTDLGLHDDLENSETYNSFLSEII